MTRECEICGKKPLLGHKISHSNIKTRIRFMPSLSFKKLMVNGMIKRVRVCVSCIKTLTKKG